MQYIIFGQNQKQTFLNPRYQDASGSSKHPLFIRTRLKSFLCSRQCNCLRFCLDKLLLWFFVFLFENNFNFLISVNKDFRKTHKILEKHEWNFTESNSSIEGNAREASSVGGKEQRKEKSRLNCIGKRVHFCSIGNTSEYDEMCQNRYGFFNDIKVAYFPVIFLIKVLISKEIRSPNKSISGKDFKAPFLSLPPPSHKIRISTL